MERLRITSAGNTLPGADNVYSLGDASRRWSSIWAANGTIQTSDRRDKVVAGSLSFAGAMVDAVDPVLFRWKEGDTGAPSPTGRAAGATPRPGERAHAGFVAQELKAAMDTAGVDFGAWGLADRHDPDSRQWLRPDQLVAVLWAALRETRAELTDFRARASGPAR